MNIGIKRINVNMTYSSLHPETNVVLAFKFFPTKSIILACNEIYLIKATPSTKNILYMKTNRANQILMEDATFLVSM